MKRHHAAAVGCGASYGARQSGSDCRSTAVRCVACTWMRYARGLRRRRSRPLPRCRAPLSVDGEGLTVFGIVSDSMDLNGEDRRDAVEESKLRVSNLQSPQLIN